MYLRNTSDNSQFVFEVGCLTTDAGGLLLRLEMKLGCELIPGELNLEPDWCFELVKPFTLGVFCEVTKVWESQLFE